MIVRRLLHGSALHFDATRTVFALSSAQGVSGVALLRVSGPRANDALRALLGKQQSLPPVRRAALRTLYDASGEPLDDAVVTRFAGPRSFTGHDTVELGVHGSIAVVRDTLRALHESGVAQPAAPGEFTRQAFAAGRLVCLLF